MVRERVERGLTLVVLLDTSLSVAGPARAAVAVAGAVLARAAAMGRLALLAFHGEVEPLVRFGERVKPLSAAYRVLASPFGGSTDLAKALSEAARVQRGLAGAKAHTVLISDMEHTAGPDPVAAAARLKDPHLVLVGKRNQALAEKMARAGGGTCRLVERLADLPAALLGLLARLAGRAR